MYVKTLAIGIDVGTGGKGRSPSAVAIYDGEKVLVTREFPGELRRSNGFPKNSLTIASNISQFVIKQIAPFGSGAFSFVFGIEVPPMVKNARTHFELSATWGMIAAAMSNFVVHYVEVMPSESKLALTGAGNAQKDAMISAARMQFGCVVTEHEADAIGAAIVAWNKRNED